MNNQWQWEAEFTALRLLPQPRLEQKQIHLCSLLPRRLSPAPPGHHLFILPPFNMCYQFM